MSLFFFLNYFQNEKVQFTKAVPNFFFFFFFFYNNLLCIAKICDITFLYNSNTCPNVDLNFLAIYSALIRNFISVYKKDFFFIYIFVSAQSIWQPLS